MSLLSEIKKYHKPETKLEASDVIKAAYKGELKTAALLQAIPGWSDAWKDAVWLCPDEESKNRIRARDKRLALTPKEFFYICESISKDGPNARSVVECLETFGGSIMLTEDVVPLKPEDPGRDLSPDDSSLWVRLLELARGVDIDFAARLLFFRGTGCRLIPNEQTGFRLEPIIDESGCNGWVSQAVYNTEKQCLWTYKDKLTELLRRLANG